MPSFPSSGSVARWLRQAEPPAISVAKLSGDQTHDRRLAVTRSTTVAVARGRDIPTTLSPVGLRYVLRRRGGLDQFAAPRLSTYPIAPDSRSSRSPISYGQSVTSGPAQFAKLRGDGPIQSGDINHDHVRSVSNRGAHGLAIARLPTTSRPRALMAFNLSDDGMVIGRRTRMVSR